MNPPVADIVTRPTPPAPTFDRSSPIPPYFQIAQDIATSIRQGTIAPGRPVPGARALARTYYVSVPTASHSIRWLHTHGYVAPGPAAHTWTASLREAD